MGTSKHRPTAGRKTGMPHYSRPLGGRGLVVYLPFARLALSERSELKGEVAERLKAAVC